MSTLSMKRDRAGEGSSQGDEKRQKAHAKAAACYEEGSAEAWNNLDTMEKVSVDAGKAIEGM